jgi:DNA-binding winged helix-turn-helix (wHTH) protein
MPSASRVLVFDDFRFVVPTRELLQVCRDGAPTPIALGSRAADLLFLLLQRPGDLVTKNEIMDAVWPNAVVEESNLTVQLSALRRALDAGRGGASSIQTVPGRGYRFTPRVTAADDVAANPPVAPSGARDSHVSVSAVPAKPVPIMPMPVQSGLRQIAGWRLAGAAVAALALLGAAAVLVHWGGFFTDRSAGGHAFDAAALPMVTDETRRTLADFATLPGAKAVAISRDGWGMASSAHDLDAATAEALQRCDTLSKAANPNAAGPCAIYAAGSEVVWPAEKRRLVWPADIRAAPLDIPFMAAEIPTMAPFRQPIIERRYGGAAIHKALAIGQERYYFVTAKGSQAEAARLAAERCADYVQASCLVVSVDDFFTVELPRLRPVTQVFTLAGDTTMSEADKQRIATIYQGRDWRALAHGRAGTWHAVAAAPSESAAINQAIELCAASDQDCRIYAIGNFRVSDDNQVPAH